MHTKYRKTEQKSPPSHLYYPPTHTDSAGSHLLSPQRKKEDGKKGVYPFLPSTAQ